MVVDFSALKPQPVPPPEAAEVPKVKLRNGVEAGVNAWAQTLPGVSFTPLKWLVITEKMKSLAHL